MGVLAGIGCAEVYSSARRPETSRLHVLQGQAATRRPKREGHVDRAKKAEEAFAARRAAALAKQSNK